MVVLAIAFLLGLVFNATPGAIFAESLRRGLRGGYAPALSVQLGSLVGDVTWAVLGLAGSAVLFQLPLLQVPLALAGTVLLAWLGWQALKDAWHGDLPVPGVEDGRAAFVTGAAMSLGNPWNIVYWAALGGVLAGLGVGEPRPVDYALFLAGFTASSVAWCFVCAGAIAWLRRLLTPVLYRALNLACGLVLVVMAAGLARRLIDTAAALP